MNVKIEKNINLIFYQYIKQDICHIHIYNTLVILIRNAKKKKREKAHQFNIRLKVLLLTVEAE